MKDSEPYPDVAGVSLVNASPTATNLDFYLDNAKVNVNPMSYMAALNYFNAIIGSRTATVKSSATSQELLTEKIPFAVNKYYSVFVTGTEPLSYLVTKDSLYAPSADKALVRFINLSPDSGPLQLASSPKAAINESVVTTTLFSNIAYKAYTEYHQVDPGKFLISIKDQATGADKATLPDVEILSGKIYTIYAKGLNAATVADYKLGIRVMRYN